MDGSIHNPPASARAVPSKSSRKPTIGITMGEPSGIGPEVIVKALSDPHIRRQARFVIYGCNEILAYTADAIEVEPFWYRVPHESARSQRRIVDNVVVRDFDEFDAFIGARREPSKAGGQASRAFVEEAIGDTLRQPHDPRYIDALVTGPISKHSWQLSGFKWPGHTELLANRTRAKRHAMMFVSPRLRVVLATTHLPLMKIRDVLTIGKVFDPIDLGAKACREIGIANPKIAVTGLNPHAGEQGMLGDEEERLIKPAIELAQDHGIDARGPFAADTIFISAASGDYDLVVAMYHDQGLIPVKLLGWDKAVNWTIGLPIIRTSPDHGTAFDLVGRNKASAGSMTASIELAMQLAQRRVAISEQQQHLAESKSRSDPAA